MQVPRDNRIASFRPLIAADQEQLWHWLHLALWDPPPAGPRPLAVLERPETRIYAEGWGRPDDLGVVAVVDGTDVGACWMRVLPEGLGLAAVDARTPQLGIALEPAYRRQGHGKALLMRTLREAWERGHAQVSLSVHGLNPAVALYEACGFRRIDTRGQYLLLLATSRTIPAR